MAIINDIETSSKNAVFNLVFFSSRQPLHQWSSQEGYGTTASFSYRLSLKF